MNAGEAAVEMLAAAGVRRLYTVPGESFLEVLDAAERHPDLALVSTRHESGASFMAEAEAKLTGIPAVAMATRGVGASNLAIGVHTARQDSTPMVVLLGHVESGFLDREAFQEVDLAAFYAQITKWSVTAPRADRLPELVRRGLGIATSGRPGPVAISVPADLFGEEIPDFSPEPPPTTSLASPSAEELRHLARSLRNAERPVILAGGGARDAREELVRVAESFRVGVYAAFRRQDVFPNDHPLYLGHLGLGVPPETLEALREADVVLVAGCRLDEVTTQSYTLPGAGCEKIQVDTDPDTIGAGMPVHRGMVAEIRAALSALARLAPQEPPRRDWSAARRAYIQSSTVRESRSGGGIDPSQVVARMNEVFPEDAIFTNDAGNFSGYLHRYRRFRHPRAQLAPANGAMGYAVPAAVAAKLAAPERTVVAVAGDGGFLMTGQEIETAVRYGANVKVVVFRNGMHGTIAMHQARAFGRVAGTEIGAVDLAAYARALGARGFTAGSPEEVEPALRKAAATEGVAVVDVVTDRDLISPTSRLSELIHEGRRR
jgi:acetolactate synthase-1/2/3 large subunit